MTTEELTMDVAALKISVAELQRKLMELKDTPAKKPWAREPITRTPEELDQFEEMLAYGKYYRVTGREAPEEWRPGDPYPEPEYPA